MDSDSDIPPRRRGPVSLASLRKGRYVGERIIRALVRAGLVTDAPPETREEAAALRPWREVDGDLILKQILAVERELTALKSMLKTVRAGRG